jgi:adenylate cyclase
MLRTTNALAIPSSFASFAPALLSALKPLWSPEVCSRLPRRVRVLVRAQEECSERLIGWLKLGLVVLFAGLYFLAPAPGDAPARAILQPVPIALLAYGLFTIVRLVLSYRRHLPYWMVINSIIIDTAVLLGMIWSFHDQYGQPAPFSLKAPTFAYIFVFIALRALRFDFRLVLTAGLAGAGGWALLVVLAVMHGEGPVTRDFVTYMTGNHVLIGAELEKIAALLIVTALLTFVVRRAETNLVTAVREETAYRQIKRFFSGGVADAIKGADAAIRPGQAVQREAAILMLDLRGFTRLSATAAPTDVVRLLTSFHERIVPVVAAHGGVVDKFLGDGVMATRPSATAAADALRALDAIMAQADAWTARLPSPFDGCGLGVNAAVAAGSVVFTTLGSADRLEYTVIGDAVNLAAKLEKHNKVTGTRGLVPAATYDRALAQGYVATTGLDRLEGQPVAGVPRALDLAVVAR